MPRDPGSALYSSSRDKLMIFFPCTNGTITCTADTENVGVVQQVIMLPDGGQIPHPLLHT